MPETRVPKLPNFILAGAPTSGTTSLHHYMGQHPQVYMSPIKEPTTFAAADMLCHPDFRRAIERKKEALHAYLAGPRVESARFWVPEWNDYLRLFANVRDQTAIGEGSVSYFWLPGAARAIQEKIPDVKLIFILRDPTDRLFSWYLMTLQTEPQVKFRDRLQRELRETGGNSPSLLRQFDGGRYATQLQRFVDLFPREQIRIYLYESFRADAQAVMRDIFAFLGVDPHHPIDMSHRHNETLVPRFPAVARLRQRILGNVPLSTWLPGPAGNALRNFYYRRKGDFAIDPDDRRMVIDYYRDEILRAEDLIGRDLSAWLR